MNRDNLLKLADFIEKLPHFDIDQEPGTDAFSMIQYKTECGAPRCIGGWAAYFGIKEGINLVITPQTAAMWLDLGVNLAEHLLFTPNIRCHYWDVTPAQAATALRRLAAIQNPVWSDSEEIWK
jgi:hypothetical protein